MRIIYTIASFFLLFNIELAAQNIPEGRVVESTTDTIISDIPDSTKIVQNSFFQLFKGKPGKAALYGLMIPAGGQIYNRRWWKLPLAYGAEGFLVWRIIESTSEYNEAQDAYIANLNGGNVMYKGQTTDVTIIKRERDKFRKSREYAWVFFIGGRLIVVFEAFIDRHLMDFDVSEDLSFNFIPSVLGPISSFTYTIPLDRREKPVFKSLLD